MIEKISAEKWTLLSEVLRLTKHGLDMPCGGRGICKKCRVRVEGEVSLLSDAERECLTEEEINNGIRLACMTKIKGECIVEYDTNADMIGVTNGKMPKFIPNPEFNSGYGAAIDIGTTTIAAYLYDMKRLRCIKECSKENRQRKYGADVISRITYITENGTKDMKLCILDEISEIINDFKNEGEINQAIITGNTAMLHFLEGLDATSLGVSPFTPKSLFGYETEICGIKTFLPHCMASYVGADITCAILASDMIREGETTLLVDVGTNGEMALWHNGEIKCCATAAGPAFEGANISMGVSGIEGAINSVFIENGKVSYTTIGNKKAIGICGSGIIDAISVMLETEALDESGFLEEDFAIGDSGVIITQKDVRQIQLAKSAICAGIMTLINECDNIDRFYVSGGFGSYINIESAGKIGLFPSELLDKTVVIGNGAGVGACMVLLNNKFKDTLQEISEKSQSVELSTSPVFMDKYIECMMFGKECLN